MTGAAAHVAFDILLPSSLGEKWGRAASDHGRLTGRVSDGLTPDQWRAARGRRRHESASWAVFRVVGRG